MLVVLHISWHLTALFVAVFITQLFLKCVLCCFLQDKVADLELQLQETIMESETSECSLLEKITVRVSYFTCLD